MILHAISDTPTLGRFIKASPIYLTIYLEHREAIFTNLTLQQLHIRGLDILQPIHYVRLFFNGPKRLSPWQFLKPAIESAIRQFQEHQRPTFALEHCLALLLLVYVERWILVDLQVHLFSGDFAPLQCMGNARGYVEAKVRAHATLGKFGALSLYVSGWPLPPSLDEDRSPGLFEISVLGLRENSFSNGKEYLEIWNRSQKEGKTHVTI